MAGRARRRYNAGVNPSLQALLDEASRIAAGPAVGRQRALADFAAALDLDDAVLEEVLRADPSKPYGRRVLLDGEHVEAMIARWTPGVPCAPHDHGDSAGVVRLLRGAARHQRWQVADGHCAPVDDERIEAGAVLSCGPKMVHSMGCAGDAEPLVTLHFYMGPIPHMMVWDVDAERTYKVNGGCGAWVPHDAPELVEASADGFHRSL